MANQIPQNRIVALPAIQNEDRKTLMVLLGSLFEKIDNLASDGKINSSEYKDLADIVSDMSKIKQEVKTHIIYRTIERQVRRKQPRPKTTEMEKMNDEFDTYTDCEFCDKRIAKSYIFTHKNESITCQRVQQTKLNVVISKKMFCEVIYPKCQSYNTDLLPRYKSIEKITMGEKLLKALEIEKPRDMIADETQIYKKIDGKWVGEDVWCVPTTDWIQYIN